eukprot:Rhum_TRINITY_DN23153_c0_g1::Rhum_TRINITY_DN23153_c0_g1_i1::g.177271::m.177271
MHVRHVGPQVPAVHLRVAPRLLAEDLSLRVVVRVDRHLQVLVDLRRAGAPRRIPHQVRGDRRAVRLVHLLEPAVGRGQVVPHGLEGELDGAVLLRDEEAVPLLVLGHVRRHVAVRALDLPPDVGRRALGVAEVALVAAAVVDLLRQRVVLLVTEHLAVTGAVAADAVEERVVVGDLVADGDQRLLLHEVQRLAAARVRLEHVLDLETEGVGDEQATLLLVDEVQTVEQVALGACLPLPDVRRQLGDACHEEVAFLARAHVLRKLEGHEGTDGGRCGRGRVDVGKVGGRRGVRARRYLVVHGEHGQGREHADDKHLRLARRIATCAQHCVGVQCTAPMKYRYCSFYN